MNNPQKKKYERSNMNIKEQPSLLVVFSFGLQNRQKNRKSTYN